MRTRDRSGMVRAMALLGFAALLATQQACTTNAATGRSQLNLISRNQEIAMGAGAAPELTKEYGGEVADAGVRSYVRSIGEELAQHTEADYPSLPWEFTVLDSDVINAFALPGGKVFISRALAEKLTNEAQLASILGHEIGHVTAQHVDERMSRQYGLAIGGSLLGALASGSESQWGAIGAQAAITGAGLYALSFDRNQESESDALGIRYMVRAGYNPIGSLQAMQVLADEAGGSGGGVQDWFTTHPHPGTRVGRIRDILERDHPGALSSPDENVFADRYRSNMLRPLGVAMAGDEEPIIAASAMSERRVRRGVRSVPTLGVMNLPGAHHGASNHDALWCSLCTRQQDEAIRFKIEAVE
ncbi:MAG: M48 family metalloprotease [Phycisphaerales bacterium]